MLLDILHTGSIVIFSSVATVSGAFMTRNLMSFTCNVACRRAALLEESGNGVNRRFLVGVLVFKELV